MLKTLHFKWLTSLFHKGANTDIDAERVANTEGLYRDAQNMRPVSVDGNSGSLEKIKGERLAYEADRPDPDNYRCIGACEAGGHQVTFWASTAVPPNDPLVKIDGTTHAMHQDIPYVANKPLQIAVRNDCGGGVVYTADDNGPLLFWDLAKMIQALDDGEETFFADFNIELVTVGLTAPANFPVHIGNEYLGVGMPVGQYCYAIRYVDVFGNRTNIGLETPLIQVPQANEVNQAPTAVYPGMRTYGGATSIDPPSPWGIKIEFRIDNYAGYDSIEIIRHQHNDGSGLTGAGETRIVGRIQLTPDQFTIHTFLDPQDSNVNELIPADEAAIQQILIKAPKCVEYMDQRLIVANYKTESHVADVTFTEVDGSPMGFVTKKLTTGTGLDEVPNGYTYPPHNTNYKSFMRGERYGFAWQAWDGVMGKAPSMPIPGANDIQFPNRRDVKDGVDLIQSDDPCYAANVNVQSADPVGPTYEVFTQGSKRKEDFNTVINASYQGGSNVIARPQAMFNEFDPNPPNNGPITFSNHIINGLPVPCVDFATYAPWRPTGNTDTIQSGYDVPPNTKVNVANAGNSSGFVPVQGRINAPTTQALGGLLHGVNNIPSWAKAFTIPRTAPAGRIVAQGIGTYALFSNGGTPAGKYTNRVHCHFPDINAGLVPLSVVEDIKANPQNYRLQFVSPLGFNTEIYNHFGTFVNAGDFMGYPYFGVPGEMADNVDMVSRVGVLYDQGTVNVGDSAPMGYQPAAGSGVPFGNYVGHDKWRSNATMQDNTLLPNYSFWQESPDQGNALLQISTFVELIDGRSSLFSIITDQFIYTPEGISVGTFTAFNDPGVRTFHQPFHVVNIIRIGAEVNNDNIKSYINTGCHVKMSACIGISDETANQEFRLVDERWEDCINYLGTDFRYAYVKLPSGVEETYLCITGNTVISLPVVLADIAGGGYTTPDGTVVTGVYEAFQDTQQRWFLRFGIYSLIPPDGSRILVKYDSDAPIKVFGGDVTIAPSIHAVIDRFATIPGPITGSNLFNLYGLPLPYVGYQLNPRYLMPREGGETEQAIHIDFMRTLRQWCIMFDCESRVPLTMSLNRTADGVSSPYKDQWFPVVHFVIRPNANLNFTAGTANGLQPGWDVDYPGEALYGALDRGGLRFIQTHNLDYAKQRTPGFTSAPAIGYRERTDFCNATAWTPKTSPIYQDVPNFRTFTVANQYLISEETGEIKLIAAMSDGMGQNLTEWTENGVVDLLTNKNILTGAAGEVVATQATDLFIPENAEKWVSRYIGMPDEMWQLAARGQVPRGQTELETMFWADHNSVYSRSANSAIRDIARGKYLKNMLPFLVNPARMAALWNGEHNEYWMQVMYFPDPVTEVESMFVYAAEPTVDNWIGRFTHSFDRYLCVGQRLFGMKQQRTYELNTGFLIDGDTIRASVDTPIAPLPGMKKEAVRFRVRSIGATSYSYIAPTAIEYLDQEGVVATHQDQAIGGVYWIKNVDGWEQWIDRTLASYDPARKRLQSELFYQRVIHEAQEDFKIVLTQTQFKEIT